MSSSEQQGGDERSQLERAGKSIGEILQQVQDLGATGKEYDPVSRSLAIGLRAVYDASVDTLTCAQKLSAIQQAMGQLREALAFLQEIPDAGGNVAMVTKEVAKTIALLFPLEKKYSSVKSTAATELALSAVAQLSRVCGSADESLKKKTVADGFAESRKQPRRSLKVEVGLHSETNFFTGFSLDISTGGIFVATFDTLPISTVVTIHICLSDGIVVGVDGTVRWVREYNASVADIMPGMGIEFAPLKNDLRETINRFLEVVPPMFFPGD